MSSRYRGRLVWSLPGEVYNVWYEVTAGKFWLAFVANFPQRAILMRRTRNHVLYTRFRPVKARIHPARQLGET